MRLRGPAPKDASATAHPPDRRRDPSGRLSDAIDRPAEPAARATTRISQVGQQRPWCAGRCDGGGMQSEGSRWRPEACDIRCSRRPAVADVARLVRLSMTLRNGTSGSLRGGRRRRPWAGDRADRGRWCMSAFEIPCSTGSASSVRRDPPPPSRDCRNPARSAPETAKAAGPVENRRHRRQPVPLLRPRADDTVQRSICSSRDSFAG